MLLTTLVAAATGSRNAWLTFSLLILSVIRTSTGVILSSLNPLLDTGNASLRNQDRNVIYIVCARFVVTGTGS